MDPLPGPAAPSEPHEHAAIGRWTRALPCDRRVLAGPGDDCALIHVDGVLAVSVDTSVQGVHFRLDWSSPQDAGWRAVATALSDLAAARALPLGALVALTLPASSLAEGGEGDAIMAGARAALDAFGCPLLGGDTVAADGPVAIAVTVLGSPTTAGPLRRSGACPGDLVLLSDGVGWAALAVAALAVGGHAPERALRAHRRPVPRLDLVPALGPATAAIDVSDGLLADAGRLAERSGVALHLDGRACRDDAAPFAGALIGGDDYALLATSPAPIPGLRRIGTVAAGPPGALFLDGAPVPPGGRGYEHGRGGP